MGSYLTFTFHRSKRRFMRQGKTAQTWFTNYLHRHIYGAWAKLGLMRWQFAAWILLAGISVFGVWQGFSRLDNLWLTEQPVQGGVYREGIVGRVRQVNPLYVENSATADVVDVVFSKLVRTTNGTDLTSDLATSWSVTPDRRTYTLKLRPEARWHDGVKVTANDVAFTFSAIQNPDTRSNLASSWDKVVVTALDESTVEFKLPASYSGFWAALAQVGILPEHRLGAIPATQYRLDEFNQRPIGSGPYILDNLSVDSDTIQLRRYPEYFLGSPRLDEVKFVQVDDTDALIDAYAKRRIDGLSQIEPAKLETIKGYSNLEVEAYRLPNYVGVFYNTAQPELADKGVRAALSQAVDRKAILSEVVNDQGNVWQYPIPAGYSGFNPQARKIGFDATAAQAALTGKLTRPLRLVTVNADPYPEIARRIQESYRAVGVSLEVTAVDAFSLQQNYIRPRQYDILLYGQDIGAESDVFAFWHSSQATDPGLNVSQYKSKEADAALEQARFGRDPNFRDAKYKEFVRIWSEDVPALLLYSPAYLYAHTVALDGVTEGNLVTPTDRLRDIHLWSLERELVPIKQN